MIRADYVTEKLEKNSTCSISGSHCNPRLFVNVTQSSKFNPFKARQLHSLNHNLESFRNPTAIGTCVPPSLPIELITDEYVAFIPISDSKILMRAHVKRPCRRGRDVIPPQPAVGFIMRSLFRQSESSESTSLDR